MRRCYIVCYDIRHNKRLQKVHKTLLGYGEAWQYSVFFCVLKKTDRIRMQADLENIINAREDQILIIDLGSNEDAAREAATVIGPSLPTPDTGTVVI